MTSFPKRAQRFSQHEDSELSSNQYEVEEYSHGVGDSAHLNKGNRLQPETIAYFRQIQDALKVALDQSQGTDSDEVDLLIQNVHEEIRGKEYRLFVNPRCSKVMELVVSHSKEEQVIDLFKRIQYTIEALMVDRCASHAVQALFARVIQLLDRKSVREDMSLGELLRETYEMLYTKLNEFVCDPYASHILRQLVLSTIGTESDFTTVLLKKWLSVPESEIHDIILSSYGSPVFQKMLEASSKSKTLAKELDPLLRKIFLCDSERFEEFLMNTYASRSLESVFQNCGNSIFLLVLKERIIPKIFEYSIHPISNFVVQNILKNLRHEKQFISIYEAFVKQGSINDLWKKNRLGVLLQLVEACAKFGDPQVQSQLFTHVTDMVACNGGKNVVENILWDCNDRIPPLRSLLIQSLMKLDPKSNKSIAEAMLSTSKDFLTFIAKDKFGSHILESFLNSDSVEEKYKNKFLDSFEGEFGGLAKDKFGSHFVEAAFEKGSLKRKKIIISELSKYEGQLSGSSQGRAVMFKCRLSDFRRDPEEWEKAQTKKRKVVAIFDDILGDEVKKQPKKKQTSKKHNNKSG